MDTVEVVAINGDLVVFRGKLGVGAVEGWLTIQNNENMFEIGRFAPGQWVYYRRYGEDCGSEREERE